MFHYQISCSDPSSRFFEIEFRVTLPTPQATIAIQLPAWRPGRYQLQHFAKNIQRFEVFDAMGFALPFQKTTKDRWLVETAGQTSILVRYNYYADVQNAGSSYADTKFWYINPVNLCPYVEGFINEPCTLSLAIPPDFEIACGLRQTSTNTLFAANYYELVDSPLLASVSLQCQQYNVADTRFYVWFYGDIQPNWPQILQDFEAFSAEQIATMGEFPEAHYHFLNLVLPTPYYHGVEHRHSTMVVLGPGEDDPDFYDDLLGVSSHELFHAWNIIRIRPKELLPYDFTKENYFTTCFVAEGVTTYYGDLFLRRSGVIDDNGYFKELQTYMKRHFEENGHASQSLVDASFDLWLDGYEAGVPNRKVSVYQKGALVALILDLTIRQKHQHQRSLDDVMRLLWQRFGRPLVGYTFDDYVQVVHDVLDEPIDWYWRDCIKGNADMTDHLNKVLNWVGLQMESQSDHSVRLVLLDKQNKNRAHWLKSCRLIEI